MISSIADQAAIAIENAKLYQQVEKANIKLKDLDRLKNEFLSIASHQVRTPLSIIKGYISLLRSNHKVGPLNEQQDRFMKNIQEANDQLINIISDFLNLSRIEQKRMKLEIAEADVEEIIEQVIGRLSHEAELKNIKLNFAHEGQDISKINIDEPKIIEVITNLIDNAIKYSPEKNEIKVTLKKDRDLLKISVADHGIGIPRDFRDKLFQKFSRAHNAIQHQPNGNGIGLFLVKKIVDAHHGKIIVKTKEGRGTTFTVNLSYSSGLKPGEEIDVNQLEKKGIIRYDEYNES
jgi:signal transduction histidine kinase